MTFPEKSALTITAILLAVFGWYFWLVLGPIAGASSPARDFAYTAVMGVALAAVTVLATVSHIFWRSCSTAKPTSATSGTG
jgi:hypothetical protein